MVSLNDQKICIKSRDFAKNQKNYGLHFEFSEEYPILALILRQMNNTYFWNRFYFYFFFKREAGLF